MVSTVVKGAVRETFDGKGSAQGSAPAAVIPSNISSNAIASVEITQTTTTTDLYINSIVILFLFWQIVFSLGGALQSYLYNTAIGTHPILTLPYIVLCFFFPYFYYPFYTFFLHGGELSQAPPGQYGGKRR